MSLINEALKRTRDASYQNAARGDAPGAGPYRASDATAPATSKRRWVGIGVLVAVLLVGGIVFFAWRTAALWPRLREEPPVKVAAPLPAPPPAAVVTPPPVVEPVKPVEPPPPPPPPEPPKLVLQGVTSVGQLREAMINDQTVREGDEIDGAKVLAIEGRRVRMQFAGREFVLQMR